MFLLWSMRITLINLPNNSTIYHFLQDIGSWAYRISAGLNINLVSNASAKLKIYDILS